MIKKHTCLVLDTETVNNPKYPLVHDLAFQIVDKEFNVLFQYRALVSEFHLFCEELLTSSNFYKSKSHFYDEVKQNGSVIIKPYNAIIGDLLGAIKDYHVTCICAYHLTFDKKALMTTAKWFNIERKQELEKAYNRLTELCLWNLACHTILDTDDYRAWATENGAIKESGNYHTNAETCYKYITANSEYVEEHTALADVIDETEILKYITENTKGYAPYGLKPNCWQLVQR